MLVGSQSCARHISAGNVEQNVNTSPLGNDVIGKFLKTGDVQHVTDDTDYIFTIGFQFLYTLVQLFLTDVYRNDFSALLHKTLGNAATQYSFSDSNDLSAVASSACTASDVLYVPTDNTAANNAELIGNISLDTGTPIIAGEEGICKGCGVATLTISYYDIGYKTGEMAYDILVNGADPATMPIEYAPQFTPKYNPTMCEALGLTPPDGYEAIAE